MRTYPLIVCMDCGTSGPSRYERLCPLCYGRRRSRGHNLLSDAERGELALSMAAWVRRESVRMTAHLGDEALSRQAASELFDAGMAGSAAASVRYLPGRGLRFSTYAVWVIRSWQVNHLRAGRPKGYRESATRPAVFGLSDLRQHPADRRSAVWTDSEWEDNLRELGSRERKVIECRYRLGMTLTETAAALDWEVTKQRVGQIERLALAKLRSRLAVAYESSAA